MLVRKARPQRERVVWEVERAAWEVERVERENELLVSVIETSAPKLAVTQAAKENLARLEVTQTAKENLARLEVTRAAKENLARVEATRAANENLGLCLFPVAFVTDFPDDLLEDVVDRQRAGNVDKVLKDKLIYGCSIQNIYVLNER